MNYILRLSAGHIASGYDYRHVCGRSFGQVEKRIEPEAVETGIVTKN